jgi:hypothetical protein
MQFYQFLSTFLDVPFEILAEAHRAIILNRSVICSVFNSLLNLHTIHWPVLFAQNPPFF